MNEEQWQKHASDIEPQRGGERYVGAPYVEHPEDVRSADELDARFFDMLDESEISSSEEEKISLFDGLYSGMIEILNRLNTLPGIGAELGESTINELLRYAIQAAVLSGETIGRVFTKEDISLFENVFTGFIDDAVPVALNNVPIGIAEDLARQALPILSIAASNTNLLSIITGIITFGLIGGLINQPDEPPIDEPRVERTQPISGTTTEFNKGEEKKVNPEDINTAQGIGWLRADFNMVGIDFFNEKFGITPRDIEDSEWTEYNFVTSLDKTNGIQISNLGNQNIIYSEPMFLPKYVPPIKPPSKQAVIMGRDKMIDQYQISQSFAPKFDGAVSVYDNLSTVYNHDEFSRNWEDNVLYHPDGSVN